MKKIKDIYITKDRIQGMCTYSTGILFVSESGEVYEGASTDVMEQIVISKLTLDDIKNAVNKEQQ